MIVASLCHDMGKVVTVANHPAIAAEILRPYVAEEVYWVILTHQDFQGRHYYQYLGKDQQAREQYWGHPYFASAEKFADDWDQISFDPDYDTLPLSHFEPMIDRVFASPKRM
jgi:predicted HD phosphohydrolase